MLLVPAVVLPSNVHGHGLFSMRHIRAGEVVSVWDDTTDFSCFPDDLLAISGLLERAILHYGYVGRDGVFRLASGDERYINHSDEPNLTGDPGHRRVALRDIAEGEELLEDYRAHEPGFTGFDRATFSNDDVDL